MFLDSENNIVIAHSFKPEDRDRGTGLHMQPEDLFYLAELLRNPRYNTIKVKRLEQHFCRALVLSRAPLGPNTSV